MNDFSQISPVRFNYREDECACTPKDYCQMVLPTDPVSFQIPNPCSYSLTGLLGAPESEFSDVSGFNLWSQGTGNDLSGAWTYNSTAGGSAETTGDSKILNIAVAIEKYTGYTLQLTADICDGATLYIVAFTSYDDDTSDDYTVIGSITGSVTDYRIPITGEYVRIGFYVDGSCAGEGEVSSISFAQVYVHTFDQCVDICIKDLDGNNMHSVPQSKLTYYEDFIEVLFYWSDTDLDPGCYTICICNSDLYFGENLFTDGDNGTFGSGIEGISTDVVSYGQSYDNAYQGVYSFEPVPNYATASQVLLYGDTEIILKPNTQYRASAWIKFGQTATALVQIETNGFTGATNDSVVSAAADTTDWKETTLVFTTLSDVTGTIRITMAGNVADAFFASVWIDNITLVEISNYDACTPCYKLADEHSCTKLLSWTNSADAFGHFYGTGFTHYLRVAAQLRFGKYEGEKESFAYADGQRAILYADKVKRQELVIGESPGFVHDAISAGLDHTDFRINGVQYINEEQNYEPNWRKSSNLAPAIVQVAKAVQNLINSICR